MKFYEEANKSRLCLSAFCSQKWFGTDFRVFSVPKTGSEQNSEDFSCPRMVWNRIVRDTAQENVMNAHEETRLFLVVVNQPKNITAISTRQTII